MTLDFLYREFSLLLSVKFYYLLLSLLLLPATSFGQYVFEGQVDPGDWNGQAYLSEIEDYRKLNGVFNEQLIQRVSLDSLGIFRFKGNKLSDKNKLYRIHVDRCASYEQDLNHFTGNCEHSKAMIIIANNRDTITLPQRFDNEIFCEAISTNEATLALLKVDSIMEAMKYEFVGLRSQTAIDNLLDDWTARLHEFGKDQDPLVGLYIYAGLTDRSTIFYDHYVKRLQQTPFYAELATRLEAAYGESEIAKQYIREHQVESNLITQESSTDRSTEYLIAGLVLFLIGCGFYYLKIRHASIKITLTPQEEKVFQLIQENKTNKEIASELFISHSTVKSHVNNIYRKLGVTSRDEIKSLKIK
ncbi:response regulator transcription factor [Gilvibacter sp.]|uniref:response regulator transcription factor n=1 Tax=Gilvibacter sp. TaxID=2729997 RepID=UPI003F49E5B1